MLHDKLKKLMDKKKASGTDHEMPEHEKHAKMAVLHELKRQAHEAMGHGLHNLKKVSVMSNDEGGLMQGLDKAKEIVADAGQAEPHDPLKGAIHPDDISETQDSDEDGDEGDGGDFGEPGKSEHSSEDTELPMKHGKSTPPEAEPDEDDEHDLPHEGIKAHQEEQSGEDGEEDGEDMDEEEVHKKLAHLIALRDKLHAKKPRI